MCVTIGNGGFSMKEIELYSGNGNREYPIQIALPRNVKEIYLEKPCWDSKAFKMYPKKSRLDMPKISLIGGTLYLIIDLQVMPLSEHKYTLSCTVTKPCELKLKIFGKEIVI